MCVCVYVCTCPGAYTHRQVVLTSSFFVFRPRTTHLSLAVACGYVSFLCAFRYALAVEVV